MPQLGRVSKKRRSSFFSQPRKSRKRKESDPSLEPSLLRKDTFQNAQGGEEQNVPDLAALGEDHIDHLQHRFGEKEGSTEMLQFCEDERDAAFQQSNGQDCVNCGNEMEDQGSPEEIDEQSGSADDEASRGEIAEEVDNFLLSFEDIVALILTTGSKRVSNDMYSVVRELLNSSLGLNKPFPSLSTLRSKIKPLAFTNLFAQTRTEHFSVEKTKSGAIFGSGSHKSSDTAPVMFVLPSEWAKRDVQNSSTRSLIWGNHFNGDKNTSLFRQFSECPAAKDRVSMLSLWELKTSSGKFVTLKKGVELNLSCVFKRETYEQLRRCGMKIIDSDNRKLNFSGRIEEFFLVNEEEQEERNFRDVRKQMQKEVFKKRNGDIWVRLKTSSGSVQIVFRVISFQKSSEFVQGLVVQPQGSKVPNVSVILEWFASDETCTMRSTTTKKRGFMKTGEEYFVYRFILYNDGFTVTNFTKGSYDGCYILLLDIPPENQTPVGAIRRLWLSPPGISSRKVMIKLIDDIEQGTFVGFQSTVRGKKVRVFLDMVGYVGDGPALSEMIDTRGLNGVSPCHLCFFSKKDQSGRKRSTFGFDPEQNSSAIRLRRSFERCKSIRNCNGGEEVLKMCGLRLLSDTELFPSPFHALQERFVAREKDVPVTSEGKRVVPALFDPYLSCLVSPDHVFLGLGSDLLCACRKVLHPSERRTFNYVSKHYLNQGSVHFQKDIFDGSAQGVNSLLISETYAILVLLPQVLEQVQSISNIRIEEKEKKTRRKVLLLCDNLSRLVSSSHFFPRSTLDGLDQVISFNEKCGTTRMENLRELAKNYVKNVDMLFNISPDFGKLLDRPNLHRLIELFHHCLPHFGSLSYFQELILEKGHQELKRGLIKSNNRNPQLQAMEVILSNDWVSRVWFIFQHHQWKWSDDMVYDLCTILGRSCKGQSAFKEEKEILRSLFREPLINILKKKAHTFKKFQSLGHWLVSNSCETSELLNVGPRHFREDVEKSLRLSLQGRFKHNENIPTVAFQWLTAALWSSEECTSTREEKRKILKRGTVFQVVTEDVEVGVTKISVITPRGSGKRTFFCCEDVVRTELKHHLSEEKTSRIFAISAKMERFNSQTEELVSSQMFRRSSDGLDIIELNEFCSVVLNIHACGVEKRLNKIACSFNENKKEVQHSKSTLDGGIYHLKGREEGYPARKA